MKRRQRSQKPRDSASKCYEMREPLHLQLQGQHRSAVGAWQDRSCRGRSRKGNWVVKRKTEKSRFSRALKAVAEWCKRNRHLPVKEQHKALGRKLWGHYSYYGITGNARSLQSFRYQVQRVWRKWLNRRSRGNHMPWEKFNLLRGRYPLPPVRVVHSVYAANV